jgi:YD repeat-containing protein
VDSTDENGNHWQRTSDAFGRLTEVMEPSGVAQTPSMESDYGYDALNNLLSVKQWGGNSGSSGAVSRSFSYDSLSRLLSAYNPETGTVGYTYDANSNVTAKTDARGVTTTYGYDALNRLLSKSYAVSGTSVYPTPSSCYQYDLSSVTNGIGRLSNAWTIYGSCATTAPSAGYLTMRSIGAYDPMGRVLNEQQFTPASQASGTTYTPAYTYDLAGNLLTSTSGGVGPTTTGTQTITPFLFTNTFDSAGRLQTVGSNQTTNYVTGAANVFPATLFSAQTGQNLPCSNSSSAAYSPFGGLQNAAYGISTSASNVALILNRAYDNRLRITCETDTGSIVSTPTSGSAAVTITGSEQSQ